MSDSSSNPPVIQIPLTKGYTTIVDEIDADLADLKWHVVVGGYAAHRFPSSYLYLHRVILERIVSRPLERSDLCDHINHNGLDNRRCNLRLATKADNQRNQGLSSANRSGYKGVCWDTRQGKWIAYIKTRGVKKSLGGFRDILDAARAYDAAAKELHGEFAWLNFPVQ